MRVIWMLGGLLGCPYVESEVVRDLDGDELDAIRYGGRDCDDNDPDVGDCDADRDGEQALGFGTDCDDGDPAVGALQPERCDGVDNDCDGLADDLDDGEVAGRSEFFADDDGDGFGAGAAVLACVAPTGFVDRAGDCNDAFAGIHPGEPERCDGVDWNCDGDPEVGAVVQWFRDTDGDGFGDPAAPLSEGCDQPPSSASNPFDCDDSDALAHPVGTETPDPTEICDGVDNDCDGLTDGDDPGLAPTEQQVVHRDVDGDGYGDPLLPALRCPNDPGFAANDLDCDDTDPAINPTSDETCAPGDEDCDGLVNSEDPDNDGVLWYADADGDGVGVESQARPVCEASGIPGHAPGFGDCNDNDATVTGDVQWFEDLDGDGFGDPASTSVPSCFPLPSRSRLPTDCDDGDAAIRPDAAELCNQVDDDCDGQVDENAPGSAFGFLDADGDGYGRFGTAPGSFCEGTASNADDCDDSDATIKPFSTEICDGLDNDCDFLVDDQDPTLVPDRFYSDGDLDGFGDPASVVTGCVAPPTFIRAGGDCDDTNPAQYFDRYIVTDTGLNPQRRPSIAAALAHPGRCVNSALTLILEIPDALPNALPIVDPADVGTSSITIVGGPTRPTLTLPSAAPPQVAGTLALEGLSVAVSGSGPMAIGVTGEHATVALTDVDLGDVPGVLVGQTVPAGPDAHVRVTLADVRLDGVDLGGLVDLQGAAVDVRLDRVAWTEGTSAGPLIALDVELPTATGFTNQVRLLDSRFDGGILGGPLLDGRNGVHAVFERSVFADLEVSAPLVCLGGTTCSGSASDPVLAGLPGSAVFRNDHFLDVASPAGVPWLLWQPSDAEATSIGTTYQDGPADAPLVTLVSVGSPDPTWTSLRDRFVRVGGGFDLPDGHLRFYESQLVDVDWPGIGGPQATVRLEDTAFIGSSAPITADTAFVRSVVHAGGTWPWPDPLAFPGAGSSVAGLFHFPDVGPPAPCGPCQTLDPTVTDLVTWFDGIPNELMIPYPSVSATTSPVFRFGATLVPGASPTGSVLWEQDPNGDGLPSAWIVFHAGTPECVPVVPQLVAPDGDPDGDGRDNVEEYGDGTWPCIAD